jgi:hypothetical protein
MIDFLIPEVNMTTSQPFPLAVASLKSAINWTWQLRLAVSFRGLNEFVVSQLPQNEIIENALRKQVKLLPNDNL